MDVVDLTAGFGARTIIAGIQLAVEPNSVTALIGPSGCGKSTLLRCLNAMHRTAKDAFATGEILLDGVDINARGVDPVLVRRRVGMVFQRPNPFPTMSIYDNVAAGLRLDLRRRAGRHRYDETVERALRQADLWAEVKDRLRSMGGSALRRPAAAALHRARARGRARGAADGRAVLGARPDLDRQDRGDDPQLKERYTIVIVTHNMQQAARVSDTTAFMTILEAGQPGALVETGPTSDDLRPAHQRGHGRLRLRPVRLGRWRRSKPASWNNGWPRSRISSGTDCATRCWRSRRGDSRSPSA